MLHDAAVGYDDLQAAAAGDPVRFKAETADAGSMEPFLQAWSFHGNTADLFQTPDNHLVVVLHPADAMEQGTWVVEGIMRGQMAYDGQSISIVEATAVTAPILFA